jgi:hypothetical protein
VVVTTGRAGTTSLFDLIQRAFDAEGAGRTTSHEWNTVLLDGLYSRYLETGDRKHLDSMKFLIMRCPHYCVQVDSAWLPVISECLGTGLTIIHLERKDRERNIDSLLENAERFPENHGYYLAHKLDAGTRPTAWHYGEMSREAWNNLTTRDRFAWHYDKIHAAAERNTKPFREVLHVATESIGDSSTLAAIARVLGLPEIPRATHLNKHVAMDGLGHEENVAIQELVGKLDLKRLANDLNYGLRHFTVYYLEQFTEKIGGAAGLDASRRKDIGEEMQRGHELLTGVTGELVQLQSVFENLFGSPAETQRAVGAPDPAGSASFRAEIATLIAQRDLARAQRDEESAQRDRLEREKDAMRGERDLAWTQRDEESAQRDRLEREKNSMRQERDFARTDRDAQATERARLEKELMTARQEQGPAGMRSTLRRMARRIRRLK